MADAMEPLKQRMERTDRVRIKGPGTDLEFSIRGIPAVKCEGRRNLPDGSATPRRCAIRCAARSPTTRPSLYMGTGLREHPLHLRGWARRAGGGHAAVPTRADPRRRRGGALCGRVLARVQPLHHPTDEGHAVRREDRRLLHFTPGQSYAEADNGNRSRVHWDLVLIQTPEYGGGEVWFDDERGARRRTLRRSRAARAQSRKPRRLGSVIHLSRCTYSVGARPLFEDLDWTLGPGDRVALVGPNGAGKTTLLRLAIGELEPERGSRIVARGTPHRLPAPGSGGALRRHGPRPRARGTPRRARAARGARRAASQTRRLGGRRPRPRDRRWSAPETSSIGSSTWTSTRSSPRRVAS